MAKFFFFALLLSPILAQIEKPIEPTECNESNQGRCECGNTEEGFTTYTFWQGDVQRCFHVFVPPELKDQILPVSVLAHCYSEDRLSGTSMASRNTPPNKAAARYGFARIGISTPNHNWVFGNDNVANDEYPQPCKVSSLIVCPSTIFINNYHGF